MLPYFFTWVALVRHKQTLCTRPVDQIKVNVTQVQLGQAAKGSFHGSLPLIFGTQFTRDRTKKQEFLASLHSRLDFRAY